MPRTPSAQKIVRYLQRMRELRAVAAPEVSYYPPLEELLNAIGAELKPAVKIVLNPSKAADGIPDCGMYTAAQLKRMRGDEPPEKPDRGAAEIKPLAHDMDELLQSEQVAKYGRSCGIVLASNYREFVLAEMTPSGKMHEIDRRTIAPSEDAFWEKAAHPQKTAEECADAVCEFLSRALSHNAPVSSAEDMAVILASYAREALAVLEQNPEQKSLHLLRDALEKALRMEFAGDRGGHFFRSTLAQTIFYGLFSAWMESDKTPFDWKPAGHEMKNPVMQVLFGEITNPARLGRLGLGAMLDGATAALNRVSQKGKLFGGADASKAIQHFYEPFLAAFDPELRKEMGVWYTPPEIVQYMVERADRVLRSELGIADGFADENVYVLDPCGGTGAYIAEVLRRICKTCKERGDGDLAAGEVKEAAMNRVIGFEILSASYVVAHWQIGALLAKLGAPFKDGERAAIYLTNALTDWTPAKLPPLTGFPDLQEERDAANEVKQKKPILVILGNPPYNAFAGTSPDEEGGLVEPYKKDLREKWGVRSGNLNDLYIRFFRMAENRIAKTGRGVVSFISNYSYTEEPLFVVMRESLLQSFDRAWIENMHGDRNKSERAPDGNSSNTIFAMRGVSSGIRQGIVIGLFCKTGKAKKAAKILYRNDIDAADAGERRAQLLASLDKTGAKFDSRYEKAKPNKENKFSFRPMQIPHDYRGWLSLADLCKSSFNGMEEARGGDALRGMNRAALEKGMRDYFNRGMCWEDFCKTGHGLSVSTKTFNARAVRERFLGCKQTRNFNAENILPYTMRLFDNGFCYYTPLPKMWHRAMAELRSHYKHGNSFFVSRAKSSVAPEGAPMFFTPNLGDRTVMESARYIPLRLYEPDPLNGDFVSANLSPKARACLQKLKFADPDKDEEAAEILWLHSLAVCYSPQYQTDNADGLRIGWPRIPLPDSADALRNSAALGKKVRDLLNIATPLNWKSPEYAPLTSLAKFRGNANNLALSESWGYKDGKGKTYPGAAKPEAMTAPPDYAFAESLGAPLAVRLNDESRWECIPSRVWEYRIGGFQPPKKWLSYRAHKIINRPLHRAEAQTFADTIRRISALILLESALDESYRGMR